MNINHCSFISNILYTYIFRNFYYSMFKATSPLQFYDNMNYYTDKSHCWVHWSKMAKPQWKNIHLQRAANTTHFTFGIYDINSHRAAWFAYILRRSFFKLLCRSRPTSAHTEALNIFAVLYSLLLCVQAFAS